VGTGRIEAFSDGVIAVIITIMVLELKPPHETTLAGLWSIAPSFAIYGLSFVVVAAFWVNHHHLLLAARRPDPLYMWSNINLLFWLSLVPFVTAYLGEHRDAPLALALYGAVLSISSLSFVWLTYAVLRHHDRMERAEFTRLNLKGIASIGLYAAAAPLAYVSIYASYAIFVLIPVSYFLPDRKLVDIFAEPIPEEPSDP
jgi:uncharacterized membrane protein